MSRFDVERDPRSRSCVVRLFGDIDMAVVPELRTELGGTLDAGCSNLVLDLSGVTYADSSALSLLMWLEYRLAPEGGRMVLAGANPDITRILELSGLVSVAASLAISPDVSTALAALNLSVEPTTEEWRRTLVMHTNVNALGPMREQVCELVKPLGFADSAVFDIKVALGEALANAVQHGSAGCTDAEVQVCVIAYSDRLVLEIVDSGAGFNGLERRSADVYASGGRGVSFMRALADRVEFERPEAGGTLVRLVKHRAGRLM